MGKITSIPLEHWQLCDRFLLSIWVSRVRWQDVASGRPLTQQCASYPRLTDLKLNLQGLCALLELLPEGCHGQQLYFSLYVNLLMWLHQHCTDSPCNTTHCDAGLVATLELCGQQISRVCNHQRWQIPPAGRKKSHCACWCTAFMAELDTFYCLCMNILTTSHQQNKIYLLPCTLHK